MRGQIGTISYLFLSKGYIVVKQVPFRHSKAPKCSMMSRKPYRFDNDKLPLASQTCPVELKAPKLITGNMM